MIDCHVHIFQGASQTYTVKWIEKFVDHAQSNGITELYLLEHTHQFDEFREMYRPIAEYNGYQRKWLSGKMTASLDSYTGFIESVRGHSFPITVRFGLEACYIPETEGILAEILEQFDWDFVTGSVHYIDGWGFDHKAEFWNGADVDQSYRRYYDIMLRLIISGLFSGVAHPDSIKCFGQKPGISLKDTYKDIAKELKKANMYAEQSGGLALNYGSRELGMDPGMLKVFMENGVRILTASDAHRPEHAGANIRELQEIINSIHCP